MKLFLYTIGICLGLSMNVYASTYITNIDANWTAVGVSTSEYSDKDKGKWYEINTISWGGPCGWSSLTYTTQEISKNKNQEISLGTAFSIGELTHYNSSISSTSYSPTSALLSLNLSFLDTDISDDPFSLTFDLSFGIDETTNIPGDQESSADHISWTTTAVATYTLDQITYTYTIELLGLADSNSLTTYEGSASSTDLWATITRTDSSESGSTDPVPEPATLALLGVGLLGLARVGKKRMN